MESYWGEAQTQHALTISRHVHITNMIEDLEIIAATPEAAHLYGYDKPSELVGKYLSETLSTEDMLRGYLMSLARQKDSRIPSRYATRIERPNGQISYVFKQTILVERPKPVHYLTFLEAAEAADYQPTPDLRDLNLTQAEVAAARAVITVRKLRELMADFGLDTLKAGALTPLEMQSILTVFQSKRNSQKGQLDVPTTSVSAPPGAPVDLLPGQTRQLPDGKFLHRCAKLTFDTLSQNLR